MPWRMDPDHHPEQTFYNFFPKRYKWGFNSIPIVDEEFYPQEKFACQAFSTTVDECHNTVSIASAG